MFSRLHLCLACSFWLSFPGYGLTQTPAPSVAATTTPEYAAEAAVLLDRQSITTMQADGTGVTETSFSVRLQSDASVRAFSVISVPFAGASQHVDFVYARVRHPDGKVIETPIGDALEQPTEVTRDAPFYSDLKQKQLPIRSLQLGDILEWKVRTVRSVPEAPGQFWGQDTFTTDGIALAETVELHVPTASHVKVWTNPLIGVPTETTSGTERILRWQHRNLKPTAGPAATAAAEAAKNKRLTPEEELTSQKGPLPSIAWTTFPDWQAVGAWYRNLSQDRAVPDAAIQAKVAELIAGKTTQVEQAQAVYDYVATQIRYIGVSFGIGRYQPHHAADALSNQYGDCKDKHTLLAAMLSVLNLHPDAVLIGAGVRFNEAVPSPASFNHLLTHLRLNGKEFWLDTTAEVAPWNTLLPAIRDQTALVIPQDGAAQLETTPAQPPSAGAARMAVSETLGKDFASDAQVVLTFQDDDAVALRSVLRQLSPAQYEQFVQQFMTQWGFGGITSEASISRIDAIENPLKITFRYKRTQDKDWGANRVTEPFMPITLPGVDEKQPPVATLRLGAPRTETSNVTMALPSGWSAELPEAVHASSPYATVDMVFHLEQGSLVAERKLTVLRSDVPATDWKTYKAWIDKAEPYSVPFIQLIATSFKALPPETPLASVSGDSAAGQSNAEDLLRQAQEQMRVKDLGKAKSLLDQVQSANPKQRDLWHGYAYIAAQRGEMFEATADLQKELAAYPDEYALYGSLAQLQHAQRDDDAALTSLRAWVAATPEDPAATAALISMLHIAKHDAEAVQVGSVTLGRLAKGDADLTMLRLTLAEVEHSMGQKAEAATTVRPLATTVTHPNQVNTVAYFMAEGGVDLSGDETRERDMLTGLETQTTTWTLDEAPATLSGKTDLLVASWDTMGWILYLEGRPAEARPFIEAAWRNAPSDEVLQHLHKVQTALHTGPLPAEQQSEQRRRTVPLGPAKGRHGVTQVRLLFGSEGILRAELDVPPVIPGAPAQKPNTSPPLAGAIDLVKTADLHAFLPANSSVRLVRNGFVNCSGESCQLVLSPLH